jgi:hypothetical protein
MFAGDFTVAAANKTDTWIATVMLIMYLRI